MHKTCIKLSDEDLVQGSDSWKAKRLGRIGSSEIGTLLGVNPYASRFELWLIKTGRIQPQDISQNFNVKRGVALEKPARDMVNAELCAEFKPCVFTLPDIDHMIYSSDGFDEKRDEIIEIKALGEKNHKLVLDTNQPIPYYLAQLHWGMMLSETPLCHFVSYCPKHFLPYKRIEVKEDKAYQEFMMIELNIFWKLVTSDTKPEMTDKDKILFREWA